MIAIVIFYVILGCFMETMAMMITTVPIVVPIITAMGYDPVWFGIIIILVAFPNLALWLPNMWKASL